MLRHIRRWPKREKTPHILLLPRHEIGYVRIPKSANSAIKHALHTFLFGESPLQAGRNSDRYWTDHPSGQATMIDYAAVSQYRTPIFLFSFVRNPFSRLASCYHDKIVAPEALRGFFRNYGYTKDMTFADFVERSIRFTDRQADIHIKSQSAMLFHGGRPAFDFLGRVETMHTDWPRLRRIIRDLKGHDLPDIETVHRLKDGRPKTAAMYTPALIKAVRERYAVDFETFYPGLAEPR